MIKYFILMSFLLFSCTPLVYYALDVPSYNLIIDDLEITGNDLNEKITCIDRWIFSSIIMREDMEIHGKPYWQTPEETIELKTGDCEDFCILFLWMCYQYLDIQPNMLILRRWEEDHAVSIYRDYVFADYYDWYTTKNYVYIEYYSWEMALIYAEYIK